MTLIIMTLSTTTGCHLVNATFSYCNAEYFNAECHHDAECHYVKCRHSECLGTELLTIIFFQVVERLDTPQVSI
jgi:hypothetical protein